MLASLRLAVIFRIGFFMADGRLFSTMPGASASTFTFILAVLLLRPFLASISITLFPGKRSTSPAKSPDAPAIIEYALLPSGNVISTGDEPALLFT